MSHQRHASNPTPFQKIEAQRIYHENERLLKKVTFVQSALSRDVIKKDLAKCLTTKAKMGSNGSQFRLPRSTELTHKLSTYELPESYTKKYLKGYSFKAMKKKRALIPQDLSTKKMKGLLRQFQARNEQWSDRFAPKPSRLLSDLVASEPNTARFQPSYHQSASQRVPSLRANQQSLFLTDSQPIVYLDSIEQSRLERSKLVIESCAGKQILLDLAITGNHLGNRYLVEIVGVLPPFPVISAETVMFPNSKIPSDGYLDFIFRGPDNQSDYASFHIGSKSWSHAFRNIKGVHFTVNLHIQGE